MPRRRSVIGRESRLAEPNISFYFWFERKTGAGTSRQRPRIVIIQSEHAGEECRGEGKAGEQYHGPRGGWCHHRLIGILIRNDGRTVSAGATIILSSGLAHVAVFFPFARLNCFRMPRKSRQDFLPMWRPSERWRSGGGTESSNLLCSSKESGTNCD